MMRAPRLITSDRGIATSLIETVLVIAIVAVISSVALVSAMGNLEDAKIAQAVRDTEIIGVSVHSFMHDTGYAPAFRSGNARGPQDDVFSVLETAGSEPPADESLNWPAEVASRDQMANQLLENRPGEIGVPYPRMGEISYARFKGWNGPYAAKMPASDPWDNKYLVNVQLLTPKGIEMASETLTLGSGQRAAVFVISAGPNRQLDTRFDQMADSFVAGSDDIIFRIQ